MGIMSKTSMHVLEFIGFIVLLVTLATVIA